MPSDIEVVIKYTKRLETILEDRFGATGRGLHEKITCVGGKLPPDTVKKLRYIATIRNKLMHDDSYKQIDDRKEFISACKMVEKAIEKMNSNPIPREPRNSLLAIAVSAAALLAAVVFAIYNFISRERHNAKQT